VGHLAPGPTWFLETLLAFSLGYSLLRTLRPVVRRPARGTLRGRQVAAFAIGIGLMSFLVRFAFPLGSEQFHLQLSVFPQYVILFSLGAAAGRRGWLETLSPSLQRRCGTAGAVAALALPAILAAGGFFGGHGGHRPFEGGWYWQSLAVALVEGVLATCVSLWTIQHYRRRRNLLRPLARRMAPGTYGAFLVHPPLLVGLALAVHPLPMPAEAKFVAVLATGVATSFGLAVLVGRRRPTAVETGSAQTPDRTLRPELAGEATGLSA
jgi:glucans biosynthesis protein C